MGCSDTCAAAVNDPEAGHVGRYLPLAARHRLRIGYVIEGAR